jgi:hypothetical protein
VTTPERYGRYYWGIRLTDGTTVMAHADDVDVRAGTLLLLGRSRPQPDAEPTGPTLIYLAYAPGAWHSIWGASCITGDPVVCE